MLTAFTSGADAPCGSKEANAIYVRRSLKTGSWERAVEISRVIEGADDPAATLSAVLRELYPICIV